MGDHLRVGMLKVTFSNGQHRLRKVLCLGAHPDDIEIGCGGTILRLIKEHSDLEFYWLVFSSTEVRKREARESAKLLLRSVRSRIAVKSYRDGFFPFHGERIKESFEVLKREYQPDLIFTHYRNDAHQDHRLIADLTWNTFRGHLILEYEIPKYDGDLGSPNLFVGLSESLCKCKVDHIVKSFPTQASKHWFSKDTFQALLRLRGIEANVPERYAEGFYCRKLAL